MNQKEVVTQLMLLLQNHYRNQGEILVDIVTNILPGNFKELLSSINPNDFNDAFYYNAETDTFHYEGEEFYTTFGGRKVRFNLTGELLDLLPEGLREVMKRVATTGSPELIPFDSNLLRN